MSSSNPLFFVEKSTPDDLATILDWLEKEHNNDDFGFWWSEACAPARPDIFVRPMNDQRTTNLLFKKWVI